MNNTYQEHDTWRTPLPTPQFALYALTPVVILFILAITPLRILGTTSKQIISLPLLASLLILPYIYRDINNGRKKRHFYCLFGLHLLICILLYKKVLLLRFAKSFHSQCSYDSATYSGSHQLFTKKIPILKLRS
jgi:hypothetical protein